MKYLLGVDIGGTKCAIALGKQEEDILLVDKISFPTQVERGYEHTLRELFDEIEKLLDKNGRMLSDIKCIGISCGGPLNSKKGLILSPPNLPGWDCIPIVELFQRKFGIQTKLQNDANACALAEWKFGAAKGFHHVIFLTFGTGMGAGLILNGRLYTGVNDMAGEIGHVRMNEVGPVGYGKMGSFEGFCSGRGIVQLARLKVLEKLQQGEKVSFCSDAEILPELNAKVLAEAAATGDALAREIYQLCGQYLGRGLSLLIDILNPEIIVIGSIFARCPDLLWPSAQEIMERESLTYSRKVCKVVPAGLGEHIGDYAALAVASMGEDDRS